VLDFAGLEDFVDLKLKNYSSGMMVRLAFSVMIQSDADVLLIDEVLAVGDAAFQQKCADVFHRMRKEGRTIVIVTHNMATVQQNCHRAILLEDGELRYIGDPEEVAQRYLRLNLEGLDGAGPDQAVLPDVHARLVDAWLENDATERINNVEVGEPLRLRAIVEARHELLNPVFAVECRNSEGIGVFSLRLTLAVEDDKPDRLEIGQRARISGSIDNPLMPGRYFLKCWIARSRAPGGFALHGLDLLNFVVFGTAPANALVSVRSDVDAVLEPDTRS